MSAPGLNRSVALVPSATPPVQPAPVGLGPSSDPHRQLSPDVPASAEPTGGFMFFLVADTVTVVRVWKRESATGIWALLVTFTPPDADVFKWITVCNVPASELFFETDATRDGDDPPIIFVEEIG